MKTNFRLELSAAHPQNRFLTVLGFPLSHGMTYDGLQLVGRDFACVRKIDLMVLSGIGQIELVTVF